jgi:hypothetical protein
VLAYGEEAQVWNPRGGLDHYATQDVCEDAMSWLRNRDTVGATDVTAGTFFHSFVLFLVLYGTGLCFLWEWERGWLTACIYLSLQLLVLTANAWGFYSTYLNAFYWYLATRFNGAIYAARHTSGV